MPKNNNGLNGNIPMNVLNRKKYNASIPRIYDSREPFKSYTPDASTMKVKLLTRTQKIMILIQRVSVESVFWKRILIPNNSSKIQLEPP